jgi:type VII secretion-associated serine protease mycosin
MLQKFTVALTLTLMVSLAWLVGNFTKISIAKEDEASVGFEVGPASPSGASVGYKKQSAEVQISGGTVTASGDTTLYLPMILRNSCFTSFIYSEIIRYNLDKINVKTVWDCYSGSGITVAVVDTGVDLDHPDLQANLVPGQTFVPGTSSPDDDQGHGSHVAGIVAGVGNNGGIIGVAPRARIMPVKVLDSQGLGSTFGVANGIRWAADQGARIINMSFGGVSNSSTVGDAVNYAYNKGALLVAAGGNCGDTSYFLNGCVFQDQPVYPAALTNVIAVASTDVNDNQSSFSNQGNYIEVAAPGSSIYSTYEAGGYLTISGTSQATPHVSGLAALIWSKNTSLTNAQVRTQIRNTAQDLGAVGWDIQFGYGRINAIAALGLLQTALVTADNFSPEEVSPSDIQAPFIPGEILFKPRAGLTADDVLDQADNRSEVKVTDQISQIGVQKLSVPVGQEEAWLTELRNSGRVEYVELNYVVTLQ